MSIPCKHCDNTSKEESFDHRQTCPACGKRKTDAAAPSRLTPQKTCIKCGHTQSHHEWACVRCGLRFDLANRHKERTQTGTSDHAPVLNLLNQHWESIREDPRDQEQHHKFIDLCQASGQIKYAGRCYRLAYETASTADKELWSRYQQRIVQRSLLMLGSPTVGSAEKSKTFGLFMLILGALFILGLAYLYFHWSKSSTVIIQQQL